MISKEAHNSDIRILLAEDNAIAQHIVSKYLTHNGYTVDIAHNGRMAWDMFNQHPYDLLLTDLRMPEMTGLELIEKIRAQDTSKTTIIVLSAHANKELRQRCLQAGANGFFSKPLRLDKLKQTLSLIATD